MLYDMDWLSIYVLLYILCLSFSLEYSDYFSYFLPDKSKSGKQKTSISKKTTNPRWNHTIVYDDLTLADLKARCLELTIWNHDKLASNEFLGGVRLSLGTGMSMDMYMVIVLEGCTLERSLVGNVHSLFSSYTFNSLTGDCEGRPVDWMDSLPEEVVLWQQMLDRPGMWVYGELKLRSAMRSLRTSSTLS